MRKWHALAPSELDALATGLGGSDLVRKLRHGQHGRNLLLLKYVGEHWAGDPRDLDDAMTTLARARAVAAGPVDTLLGGPMIGAWAASTIRALRRPESAGVPAEVGCGHLGAIAVSAAALTGIDAEVHGYARGGRVALPGAGRVELPSEERFQRVRLVVRDSVVTAEGVPPDTPLRHLAADGIIVALDDLDPYRGGHHAPPTGRLNDHEVRQWRDLFATAWAVIAEHAPDRAAEMSAGLQTLVPLVRTDARSARSATVPDAFGAFGLTMPDDPVDFAVTLVHEFQHSKLSGLIDLHKLHDGTSTTRYHAPWRTDPRPLGGLLQGIYAFLGIADFWLALSGHPPLAARARREFAIVREQVRYSLASMEASAALTGDGRRFTDGMRAAVDRLLAVRLSAEIVEQARRTLADNRSSWEQRNAVV